MASSCWEMPTIAMASDITTYVHPLCLSCYWNGWCGCNYCYNLYYSFTMQTNCSSTLSPGLIVEPTNNLPLSALGNPQRPSVAVRKLLPALLNRSESTGED